MILEADEPVVVIGIGGLGLAAINILHALGSRNIVAVDVSDEKLKTARAAGVPVTINAGSETLAQDIQKAAGRPIVNVVDFVASSETARAGVEVLAKGGIYVPVGLYGGDITLPLPTIPLRALTIRGNTWEAWQEMAKELIQLAKSGALLQHPLRGCHTPVQTGCAPFA